MCESNPHNTSRLNLNSGKPSVCGHPSPCHTGECAYNQTINKHVCVCPSGVVGDKCQTGEQWKHLISLCSYSPGGVYFSIFLHVLPLKKRGSSQENEFHICVRVCGVEGRGRSLSGQLFFVCKKDDLEKSSTKSLGGMARPKDEMGSEIVSSESDISHPILVYLSWNNNFQVQARRFPALTAPKPEFPVIFGSK